MVTGEWRGERTQAGWQAGTSRQRAGREWRRWRPLLLRPSPLTQAAVPTARPSLLNPAAPGRTTPCPTASDGPEISRGATRAPRMPLVRVKPCSTRLRYPSPPLSACAIC